MCGPNVRFRCFNSRQYLDKRCWSSCVIVIIFRTTLNTSSICLAWVINKILPSKPFPPLHAPRLMLSSLLWWHWACMRSVSVNEPQQEAPTKTSTQFVCAAALALSPHVWRTVCFPVWSSMPPATMRTLLYSCQCATCLTRGLKGPLGSPRCLHVMHSSFCLWLSSILEDLWKGSQCVCI